MFDRALVLRGGALGDFILTLPVLGALRAARPGAHIEVMAYPAVAPLALQPSYADAIRSIEYGPLAGFFARNGTLDADLSAHFGGFDLVVSYLYDPDAILRENLARAGVRRLLEGVARPQPGSHATDQLAAALAPLGIAPGDRLPHFAPDAAEAAEAERILRAHPRPVVLHPGSGSASKNWPVAAWKTLLAALARTAPGHGRVVVGGEADAEILRELRAGADDGVLFLEHLPLRTLGAVLARAALFIGHDSGVSHLAAAAGAPCLLLFGATDPAVWAPRNPRARVLRAPEASLDRLAPETVLAHAGEGIGTETSPP